MYFRAKMYCTVLLRQVLDCLKRCVCCRTSKVNDSMQCAEMRVNLCQHRAHCVRISRVGLEDEYFAACFLNGLDTPDARTERIRVGVAGEPGGPLLARWQRRATCQNQARFEC